MDPTVWPSSSFPPREGLKPNRHLGSAVMSFNDGHSEWRASRFINSPSNPADGHPSALINSRY